jgi:hypothetical protein
VITSAAAEGQFEYAMLKVRNHRDGFQDIVTHSESDGQLLDLSTSRASRLQSEYSIIAASSDTIFTLSG